MIQILGFLFSYVKNPQSRLCKAYDFNKVADIKNISNGSFIQVEPYRLL